VFDIYSTDVPKLLSCCGKVWERDETKQPASAIFPISLIVVRFISIFFQKFISEDYGTAIRLSFFALLSQALLRNSRMSSPSVEKAVAAIIRQVQLHGDDALRSYAKKFDGAALKALAVSEMEIRKARSNADLNLFVFLSISKKDKNISQPPARTSWRIKESSAPILGSDIFR